jgi:hypothetical protein
VHGGEFPQTAEIWDQIEGKRRSLANTFSELCSPASRRALARVDAMIDSVISSQQAVIEEPYGNLES